MHAEQWIRHQTTYHPWIYSGFYTVLYVATDGCGNSAQCSFTITVTDSCCNKPPRINCPADATVCPGSSIDPSITGRATATKSGAICDDPIVSRTDEVLYQSACSTVIVWHWRAFDRNQPTLEARCDQRITRRTIRHLYSYIVNRISRPAPVLTARWKWIGMCQSQKTHAEQWIRHQTTYHPGIYPDSIQYFMWLLTAVETAHSVAFTITVTDSCCNKPPTISCPADATVCPGSSIDPSITGKATATRSGAICDDPIVSRTDEVLYQSACSTVIVWHWRAFDRNQPTLEARCDQRITQTDNTPPVFLHCQPDITASPVLTARWK